MKLRQRPYLLAVLAVCGVAICTEIATAALRHATDGWRHKSPWVHREEFPPAKRALEAVQASSEPPEAELGEDMWALASPLNKHLSIDRQWELLGAVDTAFVFVLPSIFFVFARRWIGTGPALLLVVGSFWIVRHSFRMAIGLPICLAHADIHGVLDYYGVGGNVASLLFSWVEPIFTCLIIIAVSAAWRWFRRPSLRKSHT